MIQSVDDAPCVNPAICPPNASPSPAEFNFDLFERVVTDATNSMRFPRIFFGLAICVCAVSSATMCLFGEDAKPTGDLALLFFAQHCQRCHSGSKPKGNFRLESLSHDLSDNKARDAWQAVARRVEAGEMPPDGEPRPMATEVTTLISWIGQQTRDVELARREREGRVVLRRLNRIEYQNTIRDLLGVEMAIAQSLPPDA